MCQTILTLVLYLLLSPIYAASLQYHVEITGIDSSLKDDLSILLKTKKLENKAIPNLFLLKRRIKQDKPVMLDFLRAKGFYSANIDPKIIQNEEDKTSYKLLFKITTGMPYLIEEINLQIQPENSLFKINSNQLPIQVAKPIQASDVLDAESDILKQAIKASYALAKLKKRKVLINHAKHQAIITLNIDSGPFVRLGEVTFTGNNQVEKSFLKSTVAWNVNQPYDKKLLAKTREDLMKTNLFNSVRIQHADSLDKKGQLPVTMILKERKFKTISTGVDMNTDTGIGLTFMWEHRNYFKQGEKVKLDLKIAKQSFIKTLYRQPYFILRNQVFYLGADVLTEDTDAFERLSLNIGTGIERQIDSIQTADLRLNFRPVRIKDKTTLEEEDFGLVSLHLSYKRNTSDNLLDPSQGGRLSIEMAPFSDIFSSGVTFFKWQMSYRKYFLLQTSPRIVLASRWVVGGIAGNELADIPSDELFFSGGGGSLRGYGYQLASPLAFNKPEGGRSLFEFATEIRYRMMEKVGLVFFVDSGSAYRQSTPSFDEIRMGSGLGLRYVTPIGPLRFDVGIPIDIRKSIDDDYQIYLSIGQAF